MATSGLKKSESEQFFSVQHCPNNPEKYSQHNLFVTPCITDVTGKEMATAPAGRLQRLFAVSHLY